MNFLKKTGLALIITASSFSMNGQIDHSLKRNGDTLSQNNIISYTNMYGQKIVEEFKSGFDIDSTYLVSVDFQLEKFEDILGLDGDELGYYEKEGSINIPYDKPFISFTKFDLKKYEANKYSFAMAFLRGVTLHEISHQYIEEVLYDCAEKNEELIISIIPINEKREKGEKLINEGLCTYVQEHFDEIINREKQYIPTKKEELYDSLKKYDVYYKYGNYFVKPIIKAYGFKKSVKLMTVFNEYPTVEEILNPKLYYDRIIKSYNQLVKEGKIEKINE